MAIEGTVDTLNIQVQTQGVAKAQKQLNSLVGTLKMFKRLGGTMTGVAEEAKEAGEDAKDASEDVAQAGETISEKAGRTSATVKKLGASFRSAGGDSEKSAGLFARLGASFKNTTSHIASFASALKRIAMYRFLRTIIKSITASIGEGITNIYHYSQTVGTTLAPALDKAKSATLTFKNSIGAALAPVLEALIPILVQVCDWLVRFNNALAMIFSALAGKSSYTAAVTATATWGDNLKSAAGSAKELKRQLMGFDELNVLNAPSSGGSGGGGSSTPDYGSMFEERAIPNPLAEWLEDFKLVFSDVVLDWSNINGEQLAEKIISGLFTVAGLLVGGVPGAIVGFVLSLLVNKWLFDRDGVISKEEWKKIGSGIFGAIGGAVIGFMVGGVPGLLIGLTVGFSLGVALAELTGLENGKNIMDAFWAIDLIKQNWENYVVPWWNNTVIPWFNGLLDDIMNTPLFKWLSGQSGGDSFAGMVRDWISGNVTFSSEPFSFLDDIMPSSEDIGNFFKETGRAFESGWNYLTGSTFKKIWDDTGTWVNEKADAVSGWVQETFNKISNIDVKGGMENVKSTITNKFGNISSWWSGTAKPKIQSTWDTITGWFTQGNSDLGSTLDTMQANMRTKGESIRQTVRDKFDSIREKISTTWSDITNNTDFSWEGIKTTIRTKAETTKTNIITAFQGLPGKISEIFGSVKSNATKIFENMSLGSIAEEIKQSVLTAFNGLKNKATDVFQIMRDNIKTPINGVIGFINRMVSGIVGGINKCINALNNFSITLPSWLPIFGGKTVSFNIRTLPLPAGIPYLAEGGIIQEAGQLFVARERGAELIGGYHGSTAVMNNDQIVEAVSEGVRQAIVDTMGSQNTTVQIDGKTLFEIVTERNNAQVRRTGRSPLLV